MTRTLLRSRRLLAVSILLLLAGVVVLSAATRRPCLHVSSASWHVWKSGYMAKSESFDASAFHLTAEALASPINLEVSPVALPPIYFSQEESAPPENTIVVQIRNFRSPPARA